MTELLRLEVLIGSVRPHRFAPVPAEWFTRRAQAYGGFEVGVLDLAEIVLPVELTETPEAEAFRIRLAAADAFVAVTSEYNHGYPAALKTAFDSAKYEWRAKPIAFVSYGGMSGGLRAVEQLRQVAAELHMVTVRETVSFHQARRQFAPDDPIAEEAVVRMLGQLAWWAGVLREGRGQSPYPG